MRQFAAEAEDTSLLLMYRTKTISPRINIVLAFLAVF